MAERTLIKALPKICPGWAENMDTKKIITLEEHMGPVHVSINHFSNGSSEPICPEYFDNETHGCNGIFEAGEMYGKGKRLLQTICPYYKE